MTQLTTAEAADILGITRWGVYKLIDKGTLPAAKFGRAWAIDEADLELPQVVDRPGPGWKLGRARKLADNL